MRILISTGEVSGDVAGALVAGEVRRRDPSVRLFGLGGRRLAEAGVEILRETNHLGSVGLTETFGAIPAFVAAFGSILREVRRRRPRAALLVGNDLFNCLLARRLRRAGVRTFAWFPPQVWLWRSQVRPIARSYDRILTSFPEEHEVYRRAGGQTEFVGHYLRDLLTTAGENERRSARAALGLAEDDAPVVAVLPGSRTVEVRELGPLLFAAAARLAAHSPRLRFLVPAAEPGYLERIRSQIAASGLAGAQLFLGRSREALAAADVALMASGTASLEAALLGTPMVLTYRLSRVTDASVRLLRWIGWIEDEMVGLPNLLLGRRAVPELRQEHANAEELAVAVGELLERTELRAAMRGELAQIAPLLAGERGGGAAAAVAEALLAEHPAEQSVAEGAVDGAPRWAAS